MPRIATDSRNKLNMNGRKRQTKENSQECRCEILPKYKSAPLKKVSDQRIYKKK